MEIEHIIIGAAISINAFVLLITSLFSYRKYKNPKLIFVIVVFLFFFIRGALLSIGLFYQPLSAFISSYYTWLIDIIILNTLYIAALKR